MRRSIGAALVVLILGCAEADSTPEAAAQEEAAVPRVVACDLLTREEVGEVLGSPITAAEPHEVEHDETRYLTMCTWSAERDDGVLMTTTLAVRRDPSVTDPAAALERHVQGVAAEAPDYRLEPVAELDPGAGWHEEAAMLTVFRPGWSVDVVADQNAAMAPLEGAKVLMEKALERLP